MWRPPPSTQRKVRRKNLVRPAGASARYANPPASAGLVPFYFPPRRSFSRLTNFTATLCSLANLPPRAAGDPDATSKAGKGRSTSSRKPRVSACRACPIQLWSEDLIASRSINPAAQARGNPCMRQAPQVARDLQAQIRPLERGLVIARGGRLKQQLQDLQQRQLQALAERELAQARELVELRHQPADQLMAGLDGLRRRVSHRRSTRSQGRDDECPVPSLTLPSNTPGRKRRSARVSAERRERPCIYAQWWPQLRSRIGASGLIFRSFNRLEATSEGSVTCQMVPLGLDNCAS
jgi:hypothetical protein